MLLTFINTNLVWGICIHVSLTLHFARQWEVYRLSDWIETKRTICSWAQSPETDSTWEEGGGGAERKLHRESKSRKDKKERTGGGWRRIRSKRAAVKGRGIELRRIWTDSGVHHQNATCRQQNTTSHTHMRGFLFYCFGYKQSNVVK